MTEKTKATTRHEETLTIPPAKETVSLGKILGVKTNREMNKKSFVDGGDITEGLYSDVPKIPIDKNTPSFKKTLISEGPTLVGSSPPYCKVSTDYLYNFFENAKNIRFYTKINDESELVLALVEDGRISLAINLHHIVSGKPSCLDNSTVTIKGNDKDLSTGQSYLLSTADLEILIPKIKNFYDQYRDLSEQMEPIDYNLIQDLEEPEEKSLFLRIMDWFGLNRPPVNCYTMFDKAVAEEEGNLTNYSFYNELNLDRKITIERLFV